MTVARRETERAMDTIDVVLEVLDARAPEATSNPVIAELRVQRQRPGLKVLNKADLADPAVTKAWLARYNQEPDVQAVALSCNNPGQAAKIPKLCEELAPHRNTSVKPLRILILGVPNVGKSTLMNSLLKRRLAKVGNEPAVTRVQQRHALNDHVTLVDSPGLLWPKIEDPLVGFLLATIHSISAKVVVDEELAEFLADRILRRYPGLLASRYGCVEGGLDGEGALDAIAARRGCLTKGKGGGLDRDKAAKILLTEFRNGTLGRISLESPDMHDS